MTKDRINDLKNASKKKENQVIVIENKEQQESNLLRNAFERSNVVQGWIDAVEANLEKIRIAINNISNINVKRRDVDAELDSLFSQNNSIFFKTNNKLKEIDEQLKSINAHSTEGRIIGIQYNSLKNRYQDAFNQNTTQLERYKQIEKNLLQSQLKAKGVNVQDEELESMISEGKDIQLFTENIIRETEEAKRMLRDIEERHEQLLKIEKMLIEVRDLFVQMAFLVENQQELVNRVEYQAQLAQEYIGAVDLKTTRKLKNKACKKKFMIILILVIILAIIIALAVIF